MKNTNDRIIAFDLLRAAAAVYIALWHLDDYANNVFLSPLGTTFSISALSIFTFVSGFLLAKRYGRIETLRDACKFLRKRLIRIYPL